MNQTSTHWTVRHSGLMLTLAVIAVVFVLRQYGLHVPNLGVILLAPVIYGVFVGSLPGAIATAAIAMVFYTWHFMSPGGPHEVSPANLERVITTGIMYGVLIALFARLKERLRRTGRREHELRIEAGRERDRAVGILESVTDAFCTFNNDWEFTYLNGAGERLVRMSREDLLGRNVWEVFPPLVGTRFETEYRRAMSEGVTAEFEAYYEPLDLWLSARAYPAPDGLSVYLEDISARIAEQAVLQRRLHQQQAVAELGQLALKSDDLSRLMQRACELLAAALEVPLVKVLELSPDGTRFDVRAGVGWDPDIAARGLEAGRASQAGYTLTVDTPVIIENLAEERRFTAPLLLSEHGVQSGMSVKIFGGRQHVFGILGCHAREPHRFSSHDVAFLESVSHVLGWAVASARATEELSSSEALFRQLAEHLGEALFVTTATGTEVLYVNAAYEHVFGCTRQSLYDEPLSWLDALDPRDRRRAEEALARMAETATFDQELRVLRDDGNVCWVRDQVFPVRDRNGVVYRAVGIATDITAEKLAEKRAIALGEEKAARAAADAGIRARDQVLAAVSHDLRNPLHGISLSVDVLRSAVSDEKRASCLDVIKRSAGYMNRLIGDLLTAAQMEAGHISMKLDDLVPESIVAEVQAALRPELDTHALHFDLKIPPILPHVHADPVRLRQALSNVISNAVKFSPKGGVIGVELIDQQDFVKFCISDQGPGMSSDQLEHVFDRFWQGRTNDLRGVGLGLPIVKGVVEAHGGTVSVDSRPGTGTTFCFTIPVSSGPVPVPAAH